MKAKKILAILVALVLSVSMPFAVFASEGEPPEPTRDEQIKELQDAADDAVKAAEDAEKELDKITNNTDGGFEKEVDDAVTKTDTAAGAADTKTGEVDGAQTDAETAIGGIDTANPTETDKQAAIDNAETAVDNAFQKANDAVDAAQKALDEAKKAEDAAKKALDAANEATEKANEALEKANKADDIYKQLLQEAVNGDPETYNELAKAENEMTEAWNDYTIEQNKADDLFNQAKEKVEGAYDKAVIAQTEADRLFGLWVAAEAAMQIALDATGDADMKALEKHRKDARNAALAARETAGEAMAAAERVYTKAFGAVDKANASAVKANAAAKKLSDKELDELISDAVAKAQKAIAANLPPQPGVGEAIGKTKVILDNENGNTFTIQFDSKVNNVFIVLADGSEIAMNSPNGKAHSTWKSDGKYDLYGLLLVRVNGTLYWIPLQEGNMNETENNSSANVVFSGKNAVPYGNEPVGMLSYDLTKELTNTVLKEIAKNAPDMDPLDQLSVIERMLEEGEEDKDPEEKDPEDIKEPEDVKEPDDDTTITDPEVPLSPGGGGGGGDRPTNDGPRTVTGFPTTTINDGTVPLSTIDDVTVPLAAGPDTVTIIDDSVPLASLPVSGGSASSSLSFNVVVDALPVSFRREELSNDDENSDKE